MAHLYQPKRRAPGHGELPSARLDWHLWIGTANGLGFLRSRTIHTLHDVPESLHEQIFGIEEDKTGSLWITTSNHVLRVDRDALSRDAVSEADWREYGLADGLGSTQGVKRYKSVVTDSIGRSGFPCTVDCRSLIPGP